MLCFLEALFTPDSLLIISESGSKTVVDLVPARGLSTTKRSAISLCMSGSVAALAFFTLSFIVLSPFRKSL